MYKEISYVKYTSDYTLLQDNEYTCMVCPEFLFCTFKKNRYYVYQVSAE